METEKHTQGRLKELAEKAMPMPWDRSDSDIPFADRMAFKNAISPAAYLELLTQRDELLAALEDLHGQVRLFCETQGEADFGTGRAVAAIAKVKGGAS